MIHKGLPTPPNFHSHQLCHMSRLGTWYLRMPSCFFETNLYRVNLLMPSNVVTRVGSLWYSRYGRAHSADMGVQSTPTRCCILSTISRMYGPKDCSKLPMHACDLIKWLIFLIQ